MAKVRPQTSPGAKARSFGRDRHGAVAIIFALILLPLLGFAGLATDYAKATLVKRRLDLAIDSASLASLNKAVDMIQVQEKGDPASFAAGESDGTRFFLAQSQMIMDSTTPRASVKLSRDGSQIRSVVNYETDVPTKFASLFGKKTFTVRGTSTAQTTLSPFYDIHILVDTSASMGIGATEADQAILQNTVGCAFACHIQESPGAVTTYDRGHAAGAVVRMDVVREALRKVAAQLLDTPVKRYRLSLYTFHTKFEQLAPLSSELATVNTSIDKVELASDYGGTNVRVALSDLNGRIPAPGDGMTRATAKSIVIVMSDGVEDNQFLRSGSPDHYKDSDFVSFSPNAGDWAGQVQSINPAYCNGLKSRNVRLIALNTKYIVPKNDGNSKFVFIRDTLHSYIESNMSKCVSTPADYFDASSPADIDKAMRDILTSITSPIALSR